MIAIRNRHHAIRLLKHLREQRHLTRRDLAQLLYVSPKTIANRETASPALAVDTLIDTAHALGYRVALIRHHGTGTGWPT